MPFGDVTKLRAKSCKQEENAWVIGWWDFVGVGSLTVLCMLSEECALQWLCVGQFWWHVVSCKSTEGRICSVIQISHNCGPVVATNSQLMKKFKYLNL